MKMITGREFARMYSDYDDYGYEERLYSTGDYELDCILEDAFIDGYAFAQREFAKKEDHSGRNAAIAGGATLGAAGLGLGGVYAAGAIGKSRERALADKLKGSKYKKEYKQLMSGLEDMSKELEAVADAKKQALIEYKTAKAAGNKDAIKAAKIALENAKDAEKTAKYSAKRLKNIALRETDKDARKHYNRVKAAEAAQKGEAWLKRTWKDHGWKGKAALIGGPIAAAGLAAGTAGLASRRRD